VHVPAEPIKLGDNREGVVSQFLFENARSVGVGLARIGAPEPDWLAKKWGVKLAGLNAKGIAEQQAAPQR
jgi:hypothetical protein